MDEAETKAYSVLLVLPSEMAFYVYCVCCCLILCVCHRVFQQWTREKCEKKRIMCWLSTRGREGCEKERNLHTTPSFYSHLSAIFMFCWADSFYTFGLRWKQARSQGTSRNHSHDMINSCKICKNGYTARLISQRYREKKSFFNKSNWRNISKCDI